MVSDHVEFTTSHFVVESGEDAETNPGIYGKALASWVADKLRSRDIPAEIVIVAEDFGRCIMIRRKPFKLWVACASVDSSTTRWQMFIGLEQGVFGRLFGSRAAPDLRRLRDAYRGIVAAVPGVSDTEWQGVNVSASV